MFEIPDVMEFGKPSERLKPTIENEDDVKKAFGLALGQGKNPFDAACTACNDNTNLALFISQRWLNDPIVIAAKDLYLKTVYNSSSLLDAEELAARLLEMAEERNASNTFYMLEGKDRLAALKLYADIRGYTKKDAVIPGGNTFIQNTMTIKLVEPEKKVIENLNTNNEPDIVDSVSPIKLKLVG